MKRLYSFPQPMVVHCGNISVYYWKTWIFVITKSKMCTYHFIIWQFNFWQGWYEWQQNSLNLLCPCLSEYTSLSREVYLLVMLCELHAKPHFRIFNTYWNYFLSHLHPAVFYSLCRSHIELQLFHILSHDQFIYCCILSALKLYNRITPLGT